MMSNAADNSTSPQRIQAHAFSSTDIERFSVTLSAPDRARIVLDNALELRTQLNRTEEEFDLGLFFSKLHSQKLGKIFLYNSRLPSTQTLLFKELSIESDGVICLADQQSSGKGRGSNVWVSPEGCLVFSFSCSVKQPALVPFFQYIVAMAMHRAVSQLCGGDAKELIGLELKWPNDIYGPNKTKLGGVLCESSVIAGSHLFRVVAGVGFNVLNAAPTTSLRELMQHAGLTQAAAALSRETLLAAFCPHLEVLLSTLEREGFDALSDEYTRVWMHSDQPVKVQAEDGSGVKEAVVRGVSHTGYLLAEDSEGRAMELHPDGNSLDMMQGLIYQKHR